MAIQQPVAPVLTPNKTQHLVHAQWELALPALAVSGATDWADGYVAKNYNQRSVLGSYLDPLADKTLMCSVIAAMGYTVCGGRRGWQAAWRGGWGQGGLRCCAECRASVPGCLPKDWGQ